MRAARNGITALGDACGCGSLEELDLSSNPLTTLAGVRACRRLETLLLDDAGLDDGAVGTLGRLPALTELSLSGNALTEASLAAVVAASTRLVTLGLARNRIGADAGAGVTPMLVAPALESLPLLADLSVAGNACAGGWGGGVGVDLPGWALELASALPSLSLLDGARVRAEEEAEEEAQRAPRAGPVGGTAREQEAATGAGGGAEDPPRAAGGAAALSGLLRAVEEAGEDAAAVIAAHVASAVKRAPAVSLAAGGGAGGDPDGTGASDGTDVQSPSFGKVLRPMEDAAALLGRADDFRASLERVRARSKARVEESRRGVRARLAPEAASAPGDGGIDADDGDDEAEAEAAGRTAGPSVMDSRASLGFAVELPSTARTAAGSLMPTPRQRALPGPAAAEGRRGAAGASAEPGAGRGAAAAGSLMSLLRGAFGGDGSDSDDGSALDAIRQRARDAVERAARLAGVAGEAGAGAAASLAPSAADGSAPRNRYMDVARGVERAQTEAASRVRPGSAAAVRPGMTAARRAEPRRPATAASPERRTRSRLGAALQYSRGSLPSAAQGPVPAVPGAGRPDTPPRRASGPALRLGKRPSTAGLERAARRAAVERGSPPPSSPLAIAPSPAGPEPSPRPLEAAAAPARPSPAAARTPPGGASLRASGRRQGGQRARGAASAASASPAIFAWDRVTRPDPARASGGSLSSAGVPRLTLDDAKAMAEAAGARPGSARTRKAVDGRLRSGRRASGAAPAVGAVARQPAAAGSAALTGGKAAAAGQPSAASLLLPAHRISMRARAAGRSGGGLAQFRRPGARG